MRLIEYGEGSYGRHVGGGVWDSGMRSLRYS